MYGTNDNGFIKKSMRLTHGNGTTEIEHSISIPGNHICWQNKGIEGEILKKAHNKDEAEISLIPLLLILKHLEDDPKQHNKRNTARHIRNDGKRFLMYQIKYHQSNSLEDIVQWSAAGTQKFAWKLTQSHTHDLGDIIFCVKINARNSFFAGHCLWLVRANQ